MATKSTNRGRGWHGDSAGHARAGKLGGKAQRKSTTPIAVARNKQAAKRRAA